MALEDNKGKYVRIEKLEIDFASKKLFIQTNRYSSKSQRDTFDSRFDKKIADDILEFNHANGFSDELVGQYLSIIKNLSTTKIQAIMENEIPEIKSDDGVFLDPFSLDSPYFAIDRFSYESMPIKEDTSRSIVSVTLSVYKNKESFELVSSLGSDHDKAFVFSVNIDDLTRIFSFINESYSLLKSVDTYSFFKDV